MRRRGAGLASRLRERLEAEAEARRRADEARDEAAARALAERELLYDDLRSFGDEVGHFRIERHDDGLSLIAGDVRLRFRSEEGGDRVDVLREEGDDVRAAGVLYREPRLEDRWILVQMDRGKERRQPLFDEGLEGLAMEALGLSAEPEPEPAPRTSSATGDRAERAVAEARELLEEARAARERRTKDLLSSWRGSSPSTEDDTPKKRTL